MFLCKICQKISLAVENSVFKHSQIFVRINEGRKSDLHFHKKPVDRSFQRTGGIVKAVICYFQSKKIKRIFFIYFPFLKIFSEIIRMDFFLINKPAKNIAFLFCFCAVKSIQFLFAYQKAGDPFCQTGVFTDLFRISCDTDHSNQIMIMIYRQIYPFLCARKVIAFTDFDDTAFFGSFFSNFMKSTDPAFICAGKNPPGTFYKIHILSAEVSDCFDNLLGKRSGNIRCHNCLLKMILVQTSLAKRAGNSITYFCRFCNTKRTAGLYRRSFLLNMYMEKSIKYR